MNQPTDTPLDMSRYEGHTPGPWEKYTPAIGLVQILGHFDATDDGPTCVNVCDIQDIDAETANAALIADAPRLLAEVKRLRERDVELQADAERYRWLRARGVYRSDPPVVHVEWASYHAGRYIGSRQPTMELLDQAIDSARALASQKEQTR